MVLLIVLLAGGALLLRGSGGTQGRLAAIRAQGYPVSVEDMAAALGTNAVRARRNVEQLDTFALAIRVDTTRRPPRGRTNAARELEWAHAQLTPENLAQFDRLHSHLKRGHWFVHEPSTGLMTLRSIPLGKARALATILQVEAMSAAILEDSQRASAAIEAGMDLARAVDSTSLLAHRLQAIPLELITASAAEFAFST